MAAVADGLGGHVAGDIASAAVIEALQAEDRLVDPADLPNVLGKAVNTANDHYPVDQGHPLGWQRRQLR